MVKEIRVAHEPLDRARLSRTDCDALQDVALDLVEGDGWRRLGCRCCCDLLLGWREGANVGEYALLLVGLLLLECASFVGCLASLLFRLQTDLAANHQLEPVVYVFAHDWTKKKGTF